MCFSATASFAAAALTGGFGIASLAKAEDVRVVPLAAMPVLFSLQQFVEGLLWLTLPVAADGSDASVLTLAFLVFATVLWPVYSPLAAVLVEPDTYRRMAMWLVVAAGVIVAFHFIVLIAGHELRASILGGHIFYEAPRNAPPWLAVTYIIATCLGLLLSSHRALQVLGLIVSAGAIVSYVFYWEAFTSVWCFFAAAASIVAYHHVAQRARARAAARA